MKTFTFPGLHLLSLTILMIGLTSCCIESESNCLPPPPKCCQKKPRACASYHCWDGKTGIVEEEPY